MTSLADYEADLTRSRKYLYLASEKLVNNPNVAEEVEALETIREYIDRNNDSVTKSLFRNFTKQSDAEIKKSKYNQDKAPYFYKAPNSNGIKEPNYKQLFKYLLYYETKADEIGLHVTPAMELIEQQSTKIDLLKKQYDDEVQIELERANLSRDSKKHEWPSAAVEKRKKFHFSVFFEMKKELQMYFSERNFEWLSINNIIKFYNDYAEEREGEITPYIWEEIDRWICDESFFCFNSRVKDLDGFRVLNYLERCLNFRFQELDIRYFKDLFYDKAEIDDHVGWMTHTDKIEFRHLFDDFRRFYTDLFKKLIRIEVMRTLDLLLLIFQSNRTKEGMDNIHKLYLEKITLMFEKVLIRPSKERNCGNCWTHEGFNIAKRCNICFPVGKDHDEFVEYLKSDEMNNSQRYVHLIEPSVLVEQDYVLIKGVASKFLILCSELCGIIHGDYLDQTTRDITGKKRLSMRPLTFGHFEFIKNTARYHRSIKLDTVIISSHHGYVSPQDEDYLKALVYLFDRDSVNFKYYIEKAYDFFISDPTYAYSYFANASYPKSYLHLSFDECSDLSMPDIFGLYARIIWNDAIDAMYNFFGAYNAFRCNESEDSMYYNMSIAHYIMSLLSDICFKFDPSLKECFWVNYKLGLKCCNISLGRNVVSINDLREKLKNKLFKSTSLPQGASESSVESFEMEEQLKFQLNYNFELDYLRKICYLPPKTIVKSLQKKKSIHGYLDKSVKAIVWYLDYLLHTHALPSSSLSISSSSCTRFDPECSHFKKLRLLSGFLTSLTYDFKSAKLVLDILSLKHELVEEVDVDNLIYYITSYDGSYIINPEKGGGASFSELDDWIYKVPEWADLDHSKLLPQVLKGHDVELRWNDNNYYDRMFPIERFSYLTPHYKSRGIITEYIPDKRVMRLEWNVANQIDILDLIINNVVIHAYNNSEGTFANCESSIGILTKLLQFYDDEEGYRVEIPDTSKGKKSKRKPPRIFICDLECRNFISSFEFEEYARTFAHYDKDCSGGLDKDEMETIFEELGIFADIGLTAENIIADAQSAEEIEMRRRRFRDEKKKRIDDLYQEIDEDTSGTIEFHEFLQFMIKVKTQRYGASFGRQFQNLIHTEIQDTGIIQQISKRFKKCMFPIEGDYPIKQESDYFIETIKKCFDVLYDSSNSLGGGIFTSDKLQYLLQLITFLIECNSLLEFSTNLSKFLIVNFASSRFLSDMRRIQQGILSSGYERDCDSFEVYTIQVKVIYELCRLIGILLTKMTDISFVSSGLPESRTSELDMKMSSIHIIDFFLETFYSFTKFDFGIDFQDSMYSYRHKIISLCIDALENVIRFQYNLSPAMKYLLESLLSMDSHGMRSFNWLLNTALNPIICLGLQIDVEDKDEWWKAYDILDIFDFVLSSKHKTKLIRPINKDLLKELVLTSIKSSSFIIHLIDIASRKPLEKSNVDIFSIIVEVFSTNETNFIYVYNHEVKRTHLLSLLCKLIEINSEKLSCYLDEIKRNGLILLNNVFKILSRSTQFTSLSYTVNSDNKYNMIRLSRAISLLLNQSNNYITLSAAIEFLIHVIHNQPGRNGDTYHLFLAKDDKLRSLLFSIIFWIKKSEVIYHEAPYFLCNIQRLILAMFENIKHQVINEVLYFIISPPDQRSRSFQYCQYEDSKSFWHFICYPLETIRIKNDASFPDISKFDYRKVSSIRKLVSVVSDLQTMNNNNSFVENDHEVEFEKEPGVWVQCEIAKVHVNESKSASNASNEVYDIDLYDDDGRRRSERFVPSNKLRKLSFDRLADETVHHCYQLNCHAMAFEILTQEYHDVLKDLGKYSFGNYEFVRIRYMKEHSYTDWFDIKCLFYDKENGVVEVDLNNYMTIYRSNIQNGSFIPVDPSFDPHNDDCEDAIKEDGRSIRVCIKLEDCRNLILHKKKFVTLKELVMEYKKDHFDIFVSQFKRSCEIYFKMAPLTVTKLLGSNISAKRDEENLVDCIYVKTKELNLEVDSFIPEFSSVGVDNYWPILEQDICVTPSTLYLKSIVKSSAKINNDVAPTGHAYLNTGSLDQNQFMVGINKYNVPIATGHSSHGFTYRAMPKYGRDYIYDISLLPNYSSLDTIRSIQDLVTDMTACNFLWSLVDSQATLLQCFKRFVQLIVPDPKRNLRLKNRERKLQRTNSRAMSDISDDSFDGGMESTDSGMDSTPSSGLYSPGGLMTPDYSGLHTPDSYSKRGGGSEKYAGKKRSEQAIDELIKSLKNKSRPNWIGTTIPSISFELFVYLQKFELLMSLLKFRLSDYSDDDLGVSETRKKNVEDIAIYLQDILQIGIYSTNFKNVAIASSSQNEVMVTVLSSLSRGKLLSIILILLQRLISDDYSFPIKRITSGDDHSEFALTSYILSNKKISEGHTIMPIFCLAEKTITDNLDIFGIRVLCRKSKHLSKYISHLTSEEKESLNENLLNNSDTMELNDACGSVSEICLQLLRSSISVLFKSHSDLNRPMYDSDSLSMLNFASILIKKYIRDWSTILAKLSIDDCLYVHDYEFWDNPEIQSSRNPDDEDYDAHMDSFGAQQDENFRRKHRPRSGKEKLRRSRKKFRFSNSAKYDENVSSSSNIESTVHRLKGLNGISTILGFSEVILALIQGLNKFKNVPIDDYINGMLIDYFETIVNCPLLKAYKQILLNGSPDSATPQNKEKVQIYSSVYMGYDISQNESSVCEYWKRCLSYSTEMIERFLPLDRQNRSDDKVISILNRFLSEYYDIILLPLRGLHWKYINTIQQIKLANLSMQFFFIVNQRHPSMKLEFKAQEMELKTIVNRTLCFMTKMLFNSGKPLRRSNHDNEMLAEVFQLYYLKEKIKPFSRYERKYLYNSEKLQLKVYGSTLDYFAVRDTSEYQISYFQVICEASLIELFEIVVQTFLERNSFPLAEQYNFLFSSNSSMQSSDNDYSISSSGNLGDDSTDVDGRRGLPLGTSVFYIPRAEVLNGQYALPPWGYIQNSCPQENLYHIMRYDVATGDYQLDASVPGECIVNIRRPLLDITKASKASYPHLYIYGNKFYHKEKSDSVDEDDFYDNEKYGLEKERQLRIAQSKILASPSTPMRPELQTNSQNDFFQKILGLGGGGGSVSRPLRQREDSISSIRSESYDDFSVYSDTGSAITNVSGRRKRSSTHGSNLGNSIAASKIKRYVESDSEICTIPLLLNSLIYLTSDDTLRYTASWANNYSGSNREACLSMDEIRKIFESPSVFNNLKLSMSNLTNSLFVLLFNELCFYWEINLKIEEQELIAGCRNDEKYRKLRSDLFNDIKTYSNCFESCINDYIRRFDTNLGDPNDRASVTMRMFSQKVNRKFESFMRKLDHNINSQLKSRAKPSFRKGDQVRYQSDKSMPSEIVTILEVFADDPSNMYYLIRLPNGKEKQASHNCLHRNELSDLLKKPPKRKINNFNE